MSPKRVARLSSRANLTLMSAVDDEISVPITPLGIESAFVVTDGRVDAREEVLDHPAVLRSGVTRTELKLFEARYFLSLLRRYQHHEALCLYHLDAFLAALRSVTFVLQKEATDSGEFASWYRAEQDRMRSDPALRVLKDLRNEAQKEGLDAPSVSLGTLVRKHFDGKETAHVILSSILLRGDRLDNPLERFEESCAALADLIERAKEKAFLPIGPERRVRFHIKFVREMSDGQWEHFDPFAPPRGSSEQEVGDAVVTEDPAQDLAGRPNS